MDSRGIEAGGKSVLRLRGVVNVGLILVLLVVGTARPVFAVGENLPVGEDLTTWQKVLNVLKAPFLAIGALIYYPLKFVFYDLWRALADWIATGDDPGWKEELRSPDPVRRAAALRTLSQRGDASAGAEAVHALDDEDPFVRRTALLVLRQFDSTRAAQRARSALEDADPTVRGTAVFVLGETGASEDAPRLLAMAADSRNENDPFLLSALLRALVRLDPGSALPLARQWLARSEDREWLLAATAAHSLGELRDGASRGTLRERVEDERYHVRLAAAEALARLGDESWLCAQLEAGGENDRVRALLLALGRHGREVPVRLFEARIGSSDANVAAAALQALVIQDPRRGIDHAIEWVDSPNPFRRFYAYGLLTRLTGQDHGFEHRAWQEWWKGAREGYRPDPGR